jgi:SWI/SNF-related matrix-associated actin-dependent regulator of chromatin subfamily A-like protein 1
LDIRVIGTLFAIIDKYNKIDYISLLKLFDLENSINENSGLLEQKALNVLHEYEGANNYILKLKGIFNPNKRGIPTRSQCEYILNYSNTTPKVAKKWVEMDDYFSEKIANEKLYTVPPKQVWIEKLLVEKDKSYHIWGRFFESEPLTDFWLPKAAVIKNPEQYYKEIDYSKYAHRPLLSHQVESVEKLVKTKRFILADDMGLGKTTSTIVAALETEAKRILIICPASLKINWQREIENYTNRPTYICGSKRYEDADFVIVNYDILKNFHDPKNRDKSRILKSNFDLVIIDEAHYIQNKTAQRTKLINDFVKGVDRLWLLTGTPMTSRPMNYFNLLELIESPVAANWMAYVIRYCNGYQFTVGNRKVWNVMGASNLEELRDRTSRQVLRRLKTDVLDLPDKIITPVYLRLKSKEYEELMGEYFQWYEKNPDESSSLTVQFTKLTKVRKVIAQEKINSTIELVENILEQDKKVIVFTNFTDSLNKIYEHFGKQAVYLDGSCSPAKRQHAVDEFQNNEKIKVFVGNLKAAGVGITLTAAEAVIMNDLSFVPSDHAQAEDRSYRYGQKSNVSVYYPIFENTIEGVIYDILNKKKNIFETVMGDNVGRAEIVEEIMNQIFGKR